jgi:adenylate cyclase
VAQPQRLRIIRWLYLLPIPLLWILVSRSGWIDYARGHTAHLRPGLLDFIENKTVDWRFRVRGEIPAPVKVVYVEMDSASVAVLGNVPWDRAFYAEVCSALIDTGHAKAVGIDVVFSENGQPELIDHERFRTGDLQLASYLYNDPPVVLAAGYETAEDRDVNDRPIVRRFPEVDQPRHHENTKPLPPEVPEFPLPQGSRWTPPNVGLIDTINSGTRWVHLFAPVDTITYDHMALQLARLYWGLPRDGIKIGTDTITLVDKAGKARAVIPLTHHQDLEINWFSSWLSKDYTPRASFSDVLQYARALKSTVPAERKNAEEFFAQFNDSVVLIGAVDLLMHDVAATPLDSVPVPRVSVHGNLLKTIVSGIYLRRLHFAGEIAILLVLTFVVLLMAVGVGRFVGWGRAGAVLVLVLYTVGCFWVFTHFHWILPLTAPVGAAFTTSFLGVLWQLAEEEKQKSRIKSMFGAYVSPALVERMIESREDPKLGGAELPITAYFSDIQDFSVFSERLSPTQLVEVMNEYLTACTDIITAEGGTLDKYIGDAVVAMFGAPVDLSDHAYRACLASQKVQYHLAELREKWAGSRHGWPDTVRQMRTRIGLNTGAAVVGNMGSLTRFNYTMMGDSVNLAARLESGAKTYGVMTLVAESTKLGCEKHGAECVFRFLDRIVVKGRSQPVSIYELVGLRQYLKPGYEDLIAEFEGGLSAYLRQDWSAALKAFRKSIDLENAFEATRGGTIDPGRATPARVYVERCELLKENPPGADWDGVWVMRTK